VRRDILFEANMREYEANIYLQQSKITVFVYLFSIKANQQILYVKGIKMEANITF
jgi:hypothetical protein